MRLKKEAEARLERNLSATSKSLYLRLMDGFKAQEWCGLMCIHTEDSISKGSE